MKMHVAFTFCMIVFSGLSVMGKTFIPADNGAIQYFGRFDFSNQKEVAFDWPGVYIKCEFEGRSCSVVLQGRSCYDAFVDGKFVKMIVVEGPKETFLLTDQLNKGKHSLSIVKRSESGTEASVFYGLVLDEGCKVIASKSQTKRKIEFIGDSYTAGFASESISRECSAKDCDFIIFLSTNTGKAFGPQIASVFNADYQINAISGKGLVRNYNGIDKGKEFPAYYDKVLISKVNRGEQSPLWNFKSWHPDVIVIGIGINDFQADPPYADSAKFDSTYFNLVKSLKSQHSGVKVICCATRIWPNSTLIPRVKNVVDELKKNGDTSTYYFEFETENTALYGHPSVKDHQKIASELEKLISSITGWKKN